MDNYILSSKSAQSFSVTNVYVLYNGKTVYGNFVVQHPFNHNINLKDLVCEGVAADPLKIIQFDVFNIKHKQYSNYKSFINHQYKGMHTNTVKILTNKKQCDHPPMSLYVSGANGKQGCYKCGCKNV